MAVFQLITLHEDRPNPPLHSDPACIAFRSLSTSCYLGFVHRLGAGVAGELHSLGLIHVPENNTSHACRDIRDRGLADP